MWFRGIARLPAGTTAFLGLLSPVVAMLIGWVVAGEVFTPLQMLGILIVLGSISAAILIKTPVRPDASARLAKERTP
jgi:probable blue pigment (indigoidine) exporter